VSAIASDGNIYDQIMDFVQRQPAVVSNSVNTLVVTSNSNVHVGIIDGSVTSIDVVFCSDDKTADIAHKSVFASHRVVGNPLDGLRMGVTSIATIVVTVRDEERSATLFVSATCLRVVTDDGDVIVDYALESTLPECVSEPIVMTDGKETIYLIAGDMTAVSRYQHTVDRS
jgi:hypothetical protein